MKTKNNEVNELVSQISLSLKGFSKKDFLKKISRIRNILEVNSSDLLPVFSYAENFNNNSCAFTKKHSYYFISMHGDMHESENLYKCLYCGGATSSSRRSPLYEEYIDLNYYKVEEALNEAHTLINKITSSKVLKKDIERLLLILVNLKAAQ